MACSAVRLPLVSRAQLCSLSPNEKAAAPCLLGVGWLPPPVLLRLLGGSMTARTLAGKQARTGWAVGRLVRSLDS